MLGLESLFGKIKIAIFPQKKDGSGGGDSTFPTTARRTASAGESNDGNDVPINALNLVAMKILRPRPTLTSL